MERSGVLLESGFYNAHYYGTPLPLSNPILVNYSKMNDTVDNKLTASMNGRLSETNLINNSMSNSTMSRELLSQSTIDQSQSKNNKNSDPLQQGPAQLSAIALKRRRNRSNICAIDANTLPTGWVSHCKLQPQQQQQQLQTEQHHF